MEEDENPSLTEKAGASSALRVPGAKQMTDHHRCPALRVGGITATNVTGTAWQWQQGRLLRTSRMLVSRVPA